MKAIQKAGHAKPEVPLSEQAYKQALALLRLADKSDSPEIRKVALRMAEDIQKQELRQKSKLTPITVFSTLAVLGLALVAVGWYSYRHYTFLLATEIFGLSGLVYLVIVGIAMRITDQLSQSNFMKILGWLESYIKKKSNTHENKKLDQKDEACN
jgi:hypothetical protein